jgi:hypothetical protein
LRSKEIFRLVMGTEMRKREDSFGVEKDQGPALSAADLKDGK